MRDSLPTEVDATRKAFDNSASTYDDEFDALPATKRLRRMYGDILLTYFSPNQTILELNCGTGTDALFLAQHGVHVHATDLSPQMIEKAREKTGQRQTSGRMTFGVLPFSELDQLRGQQFDGAFSNMGGLNCIKDLGDIANELGAIVRPGGYLIVVVMTDFSFIETLAFLFRGNIKSAFRRSNPDGCLADVHGGKVQTFYHSPQNIKKVFCESFTHVVTMGLNIFTPPPSSVNAYRRFGSILPILEKIDDALCRVYPFNRIGDHSMVVLQRKATA
ncbi:MAG: class I SAM-dependent DNA methyltransferase [Bacteroidota bacterium]